MAFEVYKLAMQNLEHWYDRQHVDLSNRNIIISEDEYGEPDVHLIDYGSSSHRFTSPVDQIAFMQLYAAPELLGNEKERTTQQSELWSLGILIHECLSEMGLHPFALHEPFTTKLWHDVLKSGPRINVPDKYGSDIRGVLALCLKVNPAKSLVCFDDICLAIDGAIKTLPSRDTNLAKNKATLVHLTDDTRMERVLEAYSDEQVANWEQAWTDPRNTREALLNYVPPRYQLAKPSSASHEVSSNESSEVIYRHTEEETLSELLTKSDSRLCLWNDPGAGKTIFTRRLRAFLSCQAGRDALANGKPLFAVRREETKLDGSWPTDYINDLAKDLERFATERNEQAQEMVKWALKHGRVILILDALDQATTDRINNFKAFLSDVSKTGWNIRIEVTGRPFAVQQQSGVSGFVNDDWRMGGILPFDSRQQYDYLRGPLHNRTTISTTDAWRNHNFRRIEFDHSRMPAATNESDGSITAALVAWLPHYKQVTELLSNPDNLRFAKELDKQGKLAKVRNRTDFYLETCLHSLTRGTDNVLKSSPTPKELAKWEKILAAEGFATMPKDPHHFEIEGSREISRFQEAVEGYRGVNISEQAWQDIHRITAFTSRAILREASQYLWACPNRRMMEFYCGLHLARNLQPNWIDDQPNQLRCGDPTLCQNAGDPQWKESFLYAMEMPSSVRQDDSL